MERTPTVWITRGLPASGKSTWAKQMLAEHPGQYKAIEKDALRAMLDDGTWSKTKEKFVLEARDALILAALNAGYEPIVCDTNLEPKHVAHITALVMQHATVEVKDFTDVPVEECIRRDRKRPNYVGEKVIRDMWRKHLAPAPPEPPEFDPELPRAIIADLDGTLALHQGRNPYDGSRCEEDLPYRAVLDLINTLSWEDRATLLFVSAREDRWREQTARWLSRYVQDGGTENYPLFMRATGDTRPDSVVKREIYEREIAGKFNVWFVLDDRDQTVRGWRELGLPTFQVAYGDF